MVHLSTRKPTYLILNNQQQHVQTSQHNLRNLRLESECVCVSCGVHTVETGLKLVWFSLQVCGPELRTQVDDSSLTGLAKYARMKSSPWWSHEAVTSYLYHYSNVDKHKQLAAIETVSLRATVRVRPCMLFNDDRTPRACMHGACASLLYFASVCALHTQSLHCMCVVWHDGWSYI